MSHGADGHPTGLIDALDLPIVVVDCDGNLSQWNTAAAHFLCLTPADVGRSLRTIRGLEGIAADVMQLCEHIAAGGAAIQSEVRTRDGSWFVVRATPHGANDGPATGAVLTFTNVTGLRASVEQSIYEREYTKAILNTIVEPLVVLDTELRIQTANRAFHTMFKLSREETHGIALFRLGNAEWDKPALREHLERCLTVRETEPEPLEIEIASASGGRRTLSINSRRLSRGTARGALILLSIDDITERRQAETILRQQTAQFESLVNAAPIGVYLVDSDFRIRAVNSMGVPAFGPISDPIGRDFGAVMHELLGEPRATELAALFRHTLETGQPSSETEALSAQRHPNGENRYYQWQINRVPLPDGRNGVVCYFRDITAEVDARETIARSERSLAVEVSAMNRLYEMVSRLLSCADVGAALDEVLQATMTLLRADRGLAQFLNPRTQALEVVAQRGFNDGQRPTVEGWNVQTTPLLAHDGAMLGKLSTYYRQPLDLMERDRRILDLYVRQAAGFIERINVEDALRLADRRKDEFLATLAHELRNPLAPVRTAFELVRRKLGSSIVDNQLNMIDRQVRNLERIVDDLLDVSRITQGKIELRKQRLDLSVALSNAVELLRESISARRHQLSIAPPERPSIVDADPVRIEQVLTNIIANASKYTEPGGQISISATTTQSHAEIRVKDSGIGIPGDILPRVFDIFEQGRRDLARSAGGLGIGLSIVKTLTELHGGTVVATSAGQGKGSEFIVRLPLAPEGEAMEAQQPRRPDPVAADRTPKRRILVVDDNVDAGEGFVDLLTDLGHDVRLASDGQTALDLASVWPADIVFLDIGLPGMDGYEVARQMRRQNIDTCLVALTGYGHESARAMSKDAGFTQHLVKPPALETIIGMLESL